MKRATRLALGLAAAVAAHTPAGAAPPLPLRAAPPSPPAAAQGRNSINGFVFNESRRPVADVYVELLSEFGVAIQQTKTNGSGQFIFQGLGDGRYKVRVSPYGTDYADQVQEASLLPLSAMPGAGVEVKQIDFYLRLREGAGAGPFYAPGTVFAQEAPAEARRLYEKGVGELRDKREKEGFESLRKSLEFFPEYFLALDRLGTEYAVRGGQDRRYFEAARVLLTRAVEVNPNSFSSNFGLGFTQYHLGLTDKAVENLRRSVTNYNRSVNGHLWLGIAQKKAGKPDLAEAALKRADELSKGKEAEVHWHLAGLYGNQKRYGEAADALEKFLKTRRDARDAEKIRQLIAQLRQKAATQPRS